MKQKIRIGISSCLLGNKVRYDGGHKLDHYLRDTLGQFVEWVPVCPEVECGLPVPREAMRLVGDPDEPRLDTQFTGIDHTDRMQQWAGKKLDDLDKFDLCGFVFKARSPSCGIRDAQILSPSGTVAVHGPGLFAAAVAQRFPALPLQDEEGLQDPAARETFIERLFAYRP